MTDRQRLFFGFAIPPRQLEALGPIIEAVAASNPAARVMPLDNLHVTLKFLGWVEGDEVDTVRALGRSCARESAPFEVRFTEIGAFPRPRRARVVWLGLEDPAGESARLAAALDSGARAFGIEAEERAFTPHLTLARFKRPQRLDMTVEVPEQAQEHFVVSELLLYRSHLSPAGARYEISDAFPLG